MSALRRYEILLPSQFNDGRPIPQELIADTLSELEQEFGAVSCEAQAILGLWRREGELYRDSLPACLWTRRTHPKTGSSSSGSKND